MKWEKKGLVFGVHQNSDWMDNSALTPTPLLIGDKIRIFVGFRDRYGVGRVGYVDVDANNPSEVLQVSQKPCLDIGEPGCFDDNGVVPCAVVMQNEKLYLFYAGYNVGYHVRMTIFSGLAISQDFGETFKRASRVPIMERTDRSPLFRVVHTALKDNGSWKIYYGEGEKFIQGQKKTLPVYNISLLETENLTELDKDGETVLAAEGNEYRVGRPYVVKDRGIYKMFFGGGSEEITYRLAYAESLDGKQWKRIDSKLNMNLSSSGWDSEMTAYPAFVRYRDKAYLFYNGNNYGWDGFGYAELVDED